MKQYIDKSQWDELTDEQQKKFRKEVTLTEFVIVRPFGGGETGEHYPKITIGQMIEFLGEDWYKQLRTKWDELIVFKTLGIDFYCDALWEACKYKLNDD